MKRRHFLQLTVAMLASSTTSQSAWAQTSGPGPSPTEILRSDLIGQDQKVTETLVTIVAFSPGAISTWHVHPGAQELVFGLQGRLTLEIEGHGTHTISEGGPRRSLRRTRECSKITDPASARGRVRRAVL
jgi:Cupin domain